MSNTRISTKPVSWLQALALAAIRFYQVALRPVNPWGCKFHPSCSHFALEAIERHGLRRGLRLTVGRLLRCRPGSFGGYDQVPEPLDATDWHALPNPEASGRDTERARV